MAHEKFSSSEESTHQLIQGENYDYCFFSTAVALWAKNLYPQDGQLITLSTKMSWNVFENGSSESDGTLQMIGCCTTITRQLTLRCHLENFWRRKTFPYFHILPTAQIYLFPKLKSKLKGHHFATMENIQKIVTDELQHLGKMASGTAMMSGKNVGTAV